MAENIARMDPDAKDTEVVAAAKRCGAHDMILNLPSGYDFEVSAGGAALSGGQRQRIALARAFYGSPVVLVMDEPDSNLDAEGTMALARAIQGHKRRGGAAVIVAHRHGAFAQCDTVYVMEGGCPIPATSGRGKAPVRQLKAGRAAKSGGSAPVELPTAISRNRSAAPVSEPAATGARVKSLPANDLDTARRTMSSLEQQIDAAIARVTGYRPDADTQGGGDGIAAVIPATRNRTP